jgi:cytoplasmic iron level regulating protein YaaA (DUF328/UPF0246 family)
MDEKKEGESKEEFAEVSDFLTGSTGEKEILIKSLNKKIKIRKLSIGDVANITKASPDSEIEQYIWVAYKGLVFPKLTYEQLKNMGMVYVLEIAGSIVEYSGLDKESLARVANLPKTPT